VLLALYDRCDFLNGDFDPKEAALKCARESLMQKVGSNRSIMFAVAALWCSAWSFAFAQSNGPIASFSAPGRVEGAKDIMSIGTAASGVVAEVLVHNGERVHAGQLLVRIQCGAVEKELEARKSNLGEAEAVLARVLHGNRQEEIGIGVANVGLAEARAEEAAILLRRNLALVEGAISKAQIDQSKRDARITAAQLDENRAKLALLKAGSRQEDILQAQHARDAAKSLVDEAAERLSYCAVRAPSEGIVLQTLATPGQFISSAVPTTLLSLVDDSVRRVRAEVDERDLSKICVPQRAIIRAEGMPTVEMAGVSESMSAMMIPRSLSTEDRSQNSGRDVREVMLSLSGDASIFPIGLRVMVSFAACPAGQVTPAK
jgi:multidrug resistance efflux pump